MKSSVLDNIWFNGPRFFTVFIFAFAIVEKLVQPSSFYIIVNAFGPPIYFAEILLSIFISVEFFMIALLLFKPFDGMLCSAILFLCLTVLIGVLYTLDIRELCQDQEVLFSEIGPAKVLRNIGLALILLTSWRLKHEG